MFNLCILSNADLCSYMLMLEVIFALSARCSLTANDAVNASSTTQIPDKKIKFKNRTECLALLRNDLAQYQADPSCV